MDFNDYAPISAKVLTPGMKIDYSIYYEKDGVYVLLCKNVVLTEDLIDKLKMVIYFKKNIYVPKRLHKQILQESTLLGDIQSKAETFTGYAEVKERSKDLFDSVTKDNTISQEITKEITETIETTLDTVDTSIIIQTINSVRKVDEYLHTHSVNVALLNGLTGKWAGLSERDVDTLVKIGLLHDIGKLKIPPEILNKPGKLTKDEFDKIKLHPYYSFAILKNTGEVDERILLGVLQHHEKINGGGYPRGISSDSITEFARITAISDVYDAMVAKRSYKDAHSPFDILALFSEGRFSELDIEYVNIFLSCMTEELKGKSVVLSNGAVAEVVYVTQENFKYPLVKVDGEVIMTNRDLYCVSMYREEDN